MKITNKKVFHDYAIIEKYEAGINLLGSEVKSIKGGRILLTGSFVKIAGDEAVLVNAEIPIYKYSRLDEYDAKRTRKLLLHKKEIILLKARLDQGNFTLVPLSVYTKRGLIKLEIGLARGKKKHEKREKIKKRDIEREVEREFRERLK